MRIIRFRLLTLVVVGVIMSALSLSALWRVLSLTTEGRIERARDGLHRELERLAHVPQAEAHAALATAPRPTSAGMPVKPDMPVAQLPMPLTPPPGRFALCTRRQWLALTLGAGAANALALPARALQFPRDHGSHPDLHTEWWYLTGHVQAEGRLWGFQVTFFRSRMDATQTMRSAFAAKQLQAGYQLAQADKKTDGKCGEAKCGACHVFVTDGRKGLSKMTPVENAKLDTLVGVGSKSRLACQVTLLGTEPVTVELLGALSG